MSMRSRAVAAVMLAATLAVAFLASPSAVRADAMLKQPYLIYPGDPARMQVLWQLNATATSTIEWGTSTAYGAGSAASDEYGAAHQHAYTIAGLAPATKYFYRVTTDGAAYTGSFVSAPAPAATSVEFLAYGDTRTYPATHDQVAAAILAACNADPALQTMALFMGDFVGSGNNETYWTNEFFSPAYANIRALQANVPLQSTMGNHENSSPVLFTKYFPYPWVSGRFWSFDYGPVHVAVVDQYTAYAAGSTQLQWLASDLAATSKVWKIVLLHEPGWSTGNGHANNNYVQSLIQPLCLQNGVAIVFGGHNHNYGRAVVNGVVHVTTGGGGAPLEAPLAGQPGIVASAMLNHYCRVAVDGGVLRLQAINSANGALIDSFTLVRTLPDHVPPAVGLVSPRGGELWRAGSPHAIQWTATDDTGVDSVNVDVSFTGAAGPWQPVAHGLANTGAFEWTVADRPTDSASVRVTAFDHARNAAAATSDSLFRILDASAGVVPAGTAALSLASPRPNPGSGTTLLRFSLPAAGRARLEILDLSGRRLWSRASELAAGPHAWSWDGRTDQGARAQSGLYFVRLVTPWGARNARLTWRR